MAKIRVFADRSKIAPGNLEEVNLVTINDFKAPFDIEIKQQLDDEEPTLVQKVTFDPEEPVPIPEPEPEPEPTPTGLLYDSNTMGKWNNGKARKTSDFDTELPKPYCDGKGFTCEASGKPRVEVDGKGVATLQADSGHGRFYVDSINYGAITEYELRFNDAIVDTHTNQTQSRHQEGGAETNRFGGISHKIDRKTGEVGTKLEKFHNEHISGKDVKLSEKIEVGQWIKVRNTDTPNQEKKTITVKIEIDFGKGEGYKKLLEHTYSNLEPYMVDKATFMKRSYTWFRINNLRTASISLRNIKQYLPPAAST